MKGYIYKIELGEDLLYIGSTKQKLSKRKWQHKYTCFNRKGQRKLYDTLKNDYNINKENFNDSINLICVEVVDYNDTYELRGREAYYIKQLHPICNNRTPYNKPWDSKEYYKLYQQKNKQKIKEYNKQYKQDNKERIKIRDKNYRENNKENKEKYDTNYRINNKEQIKIKNKIRYQENKEQIKEKIKSYRNNNKDKIKKRKSKKIICCCGCIIAIDGIRKHKRSKNHINLLKERLDQKKLLHNEFLN